MIRTGLLRHPSSETVALHVKHAIKTCGVIQDATAQAIASYYQTPNGHGSVFAALASGVSVDKDELLDACERESALWRTDPDQGNVEQLTCLFVWAAQKP